MSVVHIENKEQILHIALEGQRDVTATGPTPNVVAMAHGLGRRPYIRALFSTDNVTWYHTNVVALYDLPGDPAAYMDVWVDSQSVYFAATTTDAAVVPTVYVRYWLYFTENS